MEKEIKSSKRLCNPIHETCGFYIDPNTGNAGCGPGDICKQAKLVEAEESAFHTAELIEATRAINKILADIPEHPNRSLSIVHLKQGTFLAFAEHGGIEIEDGITADSDPDLVVKHFKLIC